LKDAQVNAAVETWIESEMRELSPGQGRKENAGEPAETAIA
jgi:hypothetical protein